MAENPFDVKREIIAIDKDKNNLLNSIGITPTSEKLRRVNAKIRKIKYDQERRKTSPQKRSGLGIDNPDAIAANTVGSKDPVESNVAARVYSSDKSARDAGMYTDIMVKPKKPYEEKVTVTKTAPGSPTPKKSTKKILSKIAVKIEKKSPQKRFATVDPLNLFGNRNGVNPFNFLKKGSGRFSGGKVI